MSEAKLLTKKQLRDRNWTHREIRELGKNDGVVKTGFKGRPAFGYKVSRVLQAEKVRS